VKHCIDLSTNVRVYSTSLPNTHTMPIKITMCVIKANITAFCWLYFILSSFICQDSSFTLPPPQFPCSHLLATGIKVSRQYWYWVWQPIKVWPNTQYYPVLENIGQYPIPQCQYRSNSRVGKVQPAGQIWPASSVHPACGGSLPYLTLPSGRTGISCPALRLVSFNIKFGPGNVPNDERLFSRWAWFSRTLIVNADRLSYTR